jgi:hypothetical protein
MEKSSQIHALAALPAHSGGFLSVYLNKIQIFTFVLFALTRVFHLVY